MLPYLRHWDGLIYWAFRKYYFIPFSKTQDLKTKKFITNRFIRFITINRTFLGLPDYRKHLIKALLTQQSATKCWVSDAWIALPDFPVAPLILIHIRRMTWNQDETKQLKTNEWDLGYHAKDMVVFYEKLCPKPFQTHMFHDVCRFHTVIHHTGMLSDLARCYLTLATLIHKKVCTMCSHIFGMSNTWYGGDP